VASPSNAIRTFQEDLEPPAGDAHLPLAPRVTAIPFAAI
jgi:hypothetical protein